MKRLALAATYFALIVASGIANACSCMGADQGLSRWVEGLSSNADRIFLATVISISSKGTTKDASGPSAVIKVLRSLKGSGSIAQVDTSSLCQNFELRIAETRVFFTDKNGVILACSDYRAWLTDDGLILEPERLLRKRAT